MQWTVIDAPSNRWNVAFVQDGMVTLARNRWRAVADLQLELDPDLARVNCRLAEINSALLSLVLNASDAIAEKVGDDGNERGRITIRTRRLNEAVAIEIEGNGCGVSSENLPYIFAPMFSTKQSGKGSG